MKTHESPLIQKISIRGNSGDSWPVWNRGIMAMYCLKKMCFIIFVASKNGDFAGVVLDCIHCRFLTLDLSRLAYFKKITVILAQFNFDGFSFSTIFKVISILTTLTGENMLPVGSIFSPLIEASLRM